jgi:putative photosynthetic complex assembly protein 2
VHLYGFPILFSLFIWWFSTGIIVFLDGLPPRTFRWSMLGGSAILLVSYWGLFKSAADPSIHGAYLGFTCGLLAWGWHEMSLYMGVVTGPRREGCPERATNGERFKFALLATLHHELAILVSAAIILAVTWGGANQVGTWTFMILWGMRQSAKLNVFLGVRNLNEQFLPRHLRYLGSYLAQKPMNLLFPLSVTVSSVISGLLVSAAATADGFAAVGLTFLATMMILANLEHWFLVLPIPVEKLWNWSLKSHEAAEEQLVVLPGLNVPGLNVPALNVPTLSVPTITARSSPAIGASS